MRKLPVIPVAEGIRLKVEIGVKHIHSSIKSCLLKHPVITVMKKKKERAKLWTNLYNFKQTNNDH